MGDFLQPAMTHSQLRNSDRQQLSRIALKQEEISAVLSIEVDVELLSIIKAAKESRYLSMFHAVILQIHKINEGCVSHIHAHYGWLTNLTRNTFCPPHYSQILLSLTTS